MKIHPSPIKPTITIHTTTTTRLPHRQKNLRRLPHIFSKFLELPFYSDTNVSVLETTDSLKFIVDTDSDIGTDVAAHIIEIYPGVTKIVVAGTRIDDNSVNLVNEMEIDVWRFRLPELTLPELATASFSDGELVVVVPKNV